MSNEKALVERLRQPSGIGEPHDHALMREAADRIEALEAVLQAIEHSKGTRLLISLRRQARAALSKASAP